MINMLQYDCLEQASRRLFPIIMALSEAFLVDTVPLLPVPDPPPARQHGPESVTYLVDESVVKRDTLAPWTYDHGARQIEKKRNVAPHSDDDGWVHVNIEQEIEARAAHPSPVQDSDEIEWTIVG